MIGTFTADFYAFHPYGSVPEAWLPIFAPEDPMQPGQHATSGRAWSTFAIQVMCTMIFVLVILINKSPAEVAPSQIPAM